MERCEAGERFAEYVPVPCHPYSRIERRVGGSAATRDAPAIGRIR